MLTTKLSDLNRSTVSLRKPSHPKLDSKGKLLFKQAINSNQPEFLIKQEFSKHTQAHKEQLANEFVESAGREGINLLAQSPEGQHALREVYAHASKNITRFMRQIHSEQGTTAVDYTPTMFAKGLITHFKKLHVVQPINDLSDPVPLSDTPQGEWIQRDDDVLFVDGISCQDIEQRYIGDCSFMATLASVAKSDPEFIKNMITENSDGTYTVKLYDKKGNAQYITVDGELYRANRFSRSTSYAGVSNQGEIWPAIVEKAYAQMMGGYENIENKNATESIMVITGAPWAYTSFHSGNNQATIYYRISQSIEKGYPVVAVTSNHKDWYSENGLVENHAYSVLGIYTDVLDQRWVTLRNPWAHTEYENSQYTTDINNNVYNSNDGLFRMKFEDFYSQFRATKFSGLDGMPTLGVGLASSPSP